MTPSAQSDSVVCDGCGKLIAGEPHTIGYHVVHPNARCEWEAFHGGDWRCGDCRCINGGHEAFCYRCGAGHPEDA